MPEIHNYRGITYREVDPEQVKIGDSVVCMLSDAVAAVKVTGIERDVWSTGTPYLRFLYDSAPWWVEDLDMMATLGRPRVCGVFVEITTEES